jgi:epoxyqueuosine reductase
MLKAVLSGLEELGYRGGVLSVRNLTQLQADIEGPRRDGLVNEVIYEQYLSSFEWEPPASLARAKSIFVVSAPDPPVRITFTWHEKPIPVVVPPTYLHWRDVDRRVEQALGEVLEQSGHRVVLANLPKKLTAVRSGLAAYGKNNIAYVPGLGSFHRPVVLWSDIPCEEDRWEDLRTMTTCEKCKSCLRACPTGAIDADRFLLHAELCLTFHNEKPQDVPFPQWVDPSWHNCLVGCLECQRVCPENGEVKDWIVENEVFSEEETALLLDGVSIEKLPAPTAAQLERLDLIELLEFLPRNLNALLNKQE